MFNRLAGSVKNHGDKHLEKRTSLFFSDISLFSYVFLQGTVGDINNEAEGTIMIDQHRSDRHGTEHTDDEFLQSDEHDGSGSELTDEAVIIFYNGPVFHLYPRFHTNFHHLLSNFLANIPNSADYRAHSLCKQINCCNVDQRPRRN